MCPLCRPAQLRAPDPQILLPPSAPPLPLAVRSFSFRLCPRPQYDRKLGHTMARPVLILSHGRRTGSVGVFGEVAIGNPFESFETVSPPVSGKFQKFFSLAKYLFLILFWNLCAFRHIRNTSRFDEDPRSSTIRAATNRPARDKS